MANKVEPTGSAGKQVDLLREFLASGDNFAEKINGAHGSHFQDIRFQPVKLAQEPLRLNRKAFAFSIEPAWGAVRLDREPGSGKT